MTTKFAYQTLSIEHKIKYVLLFFVSIFIVVNIGVDFFTAKSQNYSFYFSEALIFSSYWLLFVPLVQLFLKLKFCRQIYAKIKISVSCNIGMETQLTREYKSLTCVLLVLLNKIRSNFFFNFFFNLLFNLTNLSKYFLIVFR